MRYTKLATVKVFSAYFFRQTRSLSVVSERAQFNAI